MEKFNDLKGILDQMSVDIEKFSQKHQNAAGTRLRKAMNELRKKAAEIRKDIQDERTKRKTEG